MLDQMLVEACSVWNHAVALQRRYHSLSLCLNWEVKYISYVRICHHFAKRIKRGLLGAQTVQEILRRQDEGYVRFFKHLSSRPPKFRKSKEFSSFVFKQTGYKLYGNEFIINKISKRFKFSYSRAWEGRVKNVRVLRSRGEYYILVVTDATPRKIGKTHNGASVGIDFGLKTFMTLSDGTTIKSPRFYEQFATKLRRWHRLLSKSSEGSGHRQAYIKQLDHLYRDLCNKRINWHYQMAHTLCKKYDYIFIEDLDITTMMTNKGWGRKLSDYGWGTFVRTLSHIATKYDVVVHKVDKWYASSKECECGYVNKDLKLKDRVWKCPVCGSIHKRDIHAAENIRRRGIVELGSVCKTETGDTLSA